MLDEHHLLGESLMALADVEPPPWGGETMGSGDDLAPAAAATPYLRRMVAVRDAMRAGPVRVDHGLVIATAAASMRGHRRGVLSDSAVVTQLLGGALDARLLWIDEATRCLVPGEQAALVDEHPLAAWGESLQPIILGDPLARENGWSPTGALLPLLYQYVVRHRVADLEPCVRGVAAEVAAAARRRRSNDRLEPYVRRELASLVALLEELGALTWRPHGSVLGTATPTFLGAFGWMLLMVNMDGPTPKVEDLLKQHGYLPANGGYVNRRDLPVPICDN